MGGIQQMQQHGIIGVRVKLAKGTPKSPPQSLGQLQVLVGFPMIKKGLLSVGIESTRHALKWRLPHYASHVLKYFLQASLSSNSTLLLESSEMIMGN